MSDPLRDVITLALALAFGPDRHLSSMEVEVIVDRMHDRHPECSRADMQALVVGELDAFASSQAAERAAARLETAPAPVRQAALEDLVAVASADGIVHRAEHTLVERLARRWGQQGPAARVRPVHAEAVLVDLALLCIALAYGADAELSDSEARLIRRKLAAWAELAELSGPDAALEAALKRYGMGRGEGALHAAIRRLRQALPASVRKVVLADLTQLANVDGRFLDEEEELLRYLVTAWGDA